MNYLPLAITAMVCLGIHYFLVKLLSKYVPGAVLALLGSLVVVPALFAYIYSTGTPVIPEQKIYLVYALLISIPLAIAVLTLYMAIDKGPLSVVMPIYGLNTMLTALLGILILRESVNVERVIGVVSAIAAIVLLSR
ncbi:EamA family transporter [Chloroflexota bacterium]